MTGDIDPTSPVQPELEQELERAGFRRPCGPGHTPGGWLHPGFGLGFEVVASAPMGTTPDGVRIRLVQPFGDDSRLRILSLEDMIADRMGQYASGAAPDMLGQARQLAALYPGLDLTYLEQRIRTETLGDHGIEDLTR